MKRTLNKFFGFLILLTLLLCLLPVSEADAKKKKGPVPVGIARAKKMAEKIKIELPGTVLPWATTRLAAEIDGRVEELLFKEGQHVEEGDPLVFLRTRPLELQLELAEAEYKRTETLLKELKNGNRVEVIDAARHSQEQAKARVTLAETELQRMDQLHKEGVVSKDTFDKAESEARAARAQFLEKSAMHDEMLAGPRIERIQQEEANLQGAQARIDIIKDNIHRATITAPFSGYIIKKETEVGEWLETGDPALSMNADSPVKVEVHLPQFHLNEVQPGTPAKIFLESFNPNDKPHSYSGKVIEKVVSGDPASRTFPVRIQAHRPDGKIIPGMLVRVFIFPRPSNRQPLFVPKDAVVRSPKETVVWVARQDKNKAWNIHKVSVQLGKENGHRVAVKADRKSLVSGDWVVVKGNERLRPKTKIKVTERLE